MPRQKRYPLTIKITRTIFFCSRDCQGHFIISRTKQTAAVTTIKSSKKTVPPLIYTNRQISANFSARKVNNNASWREIIEMGLPSL